MKGGKSKRPGTKGGSGVRGAPMIPDDIADAAEAALEDLLTQARGPSEGVDVDMDMDEPPTRTVDRATVQKLGRSVPPPRSAVPPRSAPPSRSAKPARGNPIHEATGRIDASELLPVDDDDELATHAVERASQPKVPRLESTAGLDDLDILEEAPRARSRHDEPPRPTAQYDRPRRPPSRHDEPTREMSRPDVSKLDESLSRLPLPAPPDTQPTDKEEFETLEATTSAARAHRDVELGGSSSLRVAVFEDSAHLGSVQSAIGAAGHLVVASGSGREAMRSFAETLASSSPDVVLVSLPGGEAVIDAALALEGRRPVVIASVDGAGISAVQRATTACADLVALKPHDASSLAPILFAASRLLIERKVVSAARGAEQVMRARLDEIADPEPRGLLPFEMFQRVIELEMRRARRFEYPLSIALFAVDVTPGASPPGIKGILRARAGNALIHTVRDIDVATQLDHERFLVLLPYTDVKGAAGLAQRVIAAIAAGSAVTAAGREYAPRAVGAVAGARLGEPVSFAKLMKDASKLLEQARRDAADLAVQP